MSRTLAPITSIADCAALAGNITTDVELARLGMVWKSVEAEVRRYCNQNIAQPAAAYVDFLPETDWYVPMDPLMQLDPNYYISGAPSWDGHLLPLRQGLVRSVSEIKFDTGGSGGTDAGDFPSTTIIDASSYFLSVEEKDPSDLVISWNGCVVLKAGNWPTRRRSIKVTYVAGLTAAELDDEFSDIRMAVTMEILDRYANLSAEGVGRVRKERLADWSIEYAIPEQDSRLSQSTRDALQPFVRYRLG